MLGWSRVTAIIWLGIAGLFVGTIWRATGTALTASFAYPAVCAMAVAALSLRCLLRSEPRDESVSAPGVGAPIFVFATIFGYWAALFVFGFLVSSLALVCLLGFNCAPRERSVPVVAVGVSVCLAIWFLFERVLGTSLPPGMFG